MSRDFIIILSMKAIIFLVCLTLTGCAWLFGPPPGEIEQSEPPVQYGILHVDCPAPDPGIGKVLYLSIDGGPEEGISGGKYREYVLTAAEHRLSGHTYMFTGSSGNRWYFDTMIEIIADYTLYWMHM